MSDATENTDVNTPEAGEAAPDTAAPAPKYDILVLSEKPGFMLADGGARALLRFFGGKRWISDADEAVAREWAELYLKPGPSAHEIFLTGVADSGEPVFDELVVRFGTRAVVPPFGSSDPTHFYMELRGARFKEPRGVFRKAMLDLLRLRVGTVWRPAEPPPPHAVVPEGEEPEEPKKRDGRPGGAVGTRVEEF